jgi:hypothetical protein
VIDLNTVVSNLGYTHRELDVAFNEICDKVNWKRPFTAIIPSVDYMLYNEASIYFTGGGIEIVQKQNDDKIVVNGKGYYFYIGA